MKAEFIFRTATAIMVAGALGYAAPSKADPPSWSHGRGMAVILAERDDDNDNDNDHGRHERRQEEDGDHEHHHEHHDHDDEDHDHNHEHEGGHDNDHDRDVRLEDRDRIVIREYIGHHRDSWCPPGLVKRRHDCLPPGQLGYQVGTVLPPEVRYYVLPNTVVRTLTPLPPEDIYVRTGGNVYVMDKTTRTILDAVTLMNDLQ